MSCHGNGSWNEDYWDPLSPGDIPHLEVLTNEGQTDSRSSLSVE